MIVIAFLGLVVNLSMLKVLGGHGHSHGSHGHGHASHGHAHESHDHSHGHSKDSNETCSSN